MLIFYIMIFYWYLMKTGASSERINSKNITKEIPFLDKFQQHDYNLTFERIETVRHDKHFVAFVKAVTLKHNRTWTVVNGSIMYNMDVGYDMELVTQMYKFASNEYRTFPCRFQLNFCNAVEKNVMGMGDYHKCGTFSGCPLLKGINYTVCNWAPNPSMFPPLVPNGEYMGELQAMLGSIELFTLRAYIKVFRPII